MMCKNMWFLVASFYSALVHIWQNPCPWCVVYVIWS